MSYMQSGTYADLSSEMQTFDASSRSSAEDEKLINDHMVIVTKIAHALNRKMGGRADVEELIQTGYVALVEAAKNYQDMGYKFATYASIRIRGAMIDDVRRQATMCRSTMEIRKKMAIAKRSLEHSLHRSPTDTELAEALQMDGEQYADAVRRGEMTQIQSLDDTYTDHMAVFAIPDMPADEALIRDDMSKALSTCLSMLPERQAMIMRLFFIEEMGLAEIGNKLNIGAARVCQLKKQALATMQGMMIPMT